MFGPDQTFLVGVEDGPDDALKCYVDHRSRGLYVLVTDPDAQGQIRRAWSSGGHVLIPAPRPDQLFKDSDHE